MTIGEIANILAVSVHTLRYYERIGLIQQVDRVSGRRNYSKADLAWLEFIQRLKRTRMPLKEILQYANLWYEGDRTIKQRKAMLLTHRHRLVDEMAALQAHLDILDRKIELVRNSRKTRRYFAPPGRGLDRMLRAHVPPKRLGDKC